MKLWRVHLRPDADGVDPVDVCIQQEVIGIGWRVSKRPSNRDEYWALGEKEYGDIGWSRAANAIGWRMEIGDLVWVRDFFGIYYVGKITGEWEYGDNPDNLKADIINIRPCKLYRVGTNVAVKIINSFRPSATVQRIHDETAELFSVFVYNKVANDSLPLPPIKKIDIYSLLSDVDLEDIVSLYLQKEKGLLFIPSSRSRRNDTISYEYQLVDPQNAQPVFVQVKSGDIVLNPSKYYKFPHKFYLFSPAGYTETSQREHIICIDKKDIDIFLESTRNLLPLNISAWFDLRDMLEK
ncbi:hypothetical protein [Thermodesulforhabdus norvegica]|uniref:Uncharacterized protein n=1 Tax=Thermodesulforhabdus norvegica TaxID=39841 RepID=A0A1I4VF28_9BACT|nr:hypothetical protein [Thermodesulforhabdus norvegica]SFM99769.1 hypothetical protein SAMN05660836_02265 [Thermodesulforhabdus norvegica]